MIMVDMEELKNLLKDQRKDISILEEVTKVHERTLDALGRGKHQHRNNERCLEGYLHVDPIIDEHDNQEEGRAGLRWKS